MPLSVQTGFNSRSAIQLKRTQSNTANILWSCTGLSLNLVSKKTAFGNRYLINFLLIKFYFNNSKRILKETRVNCGQALDAVGERRCALIRMKLLYEVNATYGLVA